MSFAIVGTVAIAAAATKAGVGIAKGIAGGIQAKKAAREQRAAQKELDKNKALYASLDTSNPYLNMENTMEDLTVNQQQADFERQAFQQTQANIMENLRGAAGGSGIASLAQALAAQGTLQTRQVSVDIARQEAMNQRLRAQGDSAREMAIRGGEQMVQEAEMRRQATLLGVAYQGAAGAASGVQAAYANQMSAAATSAQMAGSTASSAFNVLGDIIDMPDVPFKKEGE